MNHKQGSTINALRASANLLDANPVFAPLKDSTARKNIDAAVAALDASGNDQDGSTRSAKQGTTDIKNLARALRQHHMDAVARSARKAKLSGDDLTALSVPKKTSVQQLLKAAGGMSQAASRHVDALTAAGAPPDFIAQLDATRMALDALVQSRDVDETARIKATAALEAAEAEGISALHVIDVQVRKLAAKDKPLLKAWASAKRISGKPGVPRGATAAATAADAQVQAQAQANAGQPATTPATVTVTATTPATPAAS